MDASQNIKPEAAPSYFSELWANKLLLIVGVIGLGVGYGFSPYVYTIMAPHLLAEFNWPRSEFTAINALMLFIIFMFPLTGRISDILGVKKSALIGVIAMPLAYLAFAFQNGDMKVFIAIHVTQTALALTTTAITFTRQIVHFFNRARGLALAIVASGPAFFGAFVAPLLNNYVEAHGWREGYLAAAAASAVLGGLALLFLPSSKSAAAAPPLAKLSSTKSDYASIFRNRGFWILMWAILLCHLPTVVALSQLTLLLKDNGISTAHASIMLSAFATGTLIGRFGCGLALDRWPMHIVAALGLGLPVIGMVLLASPFDAPAILLIAVVFIALASGAEADLLGYIIANKFGTRIYSSVLGLLSVALTIAGALGALLLSLSVGLTNSSNLFLLISAASAAIGSLLLLQLKNIKPYVEEPEA